MKAINFLNYRLLVFSGLATGSGVLAPEFNINEIKGRVLVIKSIQFILYADTEIKEFGVYDMTPAQIETFQADARERVHFVRDLYLLNQDVTIRVNGNKLPMFATSNGVIPDLKLDNLFIRYPEKVNDTGVEVSAVFNAVGGNLYAKCLMEVYLEDPLKKERAPIEIDHEQNWDWSPY